MSYCNSNSYGTNGNSACSTEDRGVRSLPWPFRVQVPGYVAGWPT